MMDKDERIVTKLLSGIFQDLKMKEKTTSVRFVHKSGLWSLGFVWYVNVFCQCKLNMLSFFIRQENNSIQQILAFLSFNNVNI